LSVFAKKKKKKKNYTVHQQCQCHQTNQKPRASQKVKTHWGV